MKYLLFLDDERFPPLQHDVLSKWSHDWIIVRSYDLFKSTIIELGCPVFISFDHDLGGDETGLDCAKWLVEMHMDGKVEFPEEFDFYVHSQNPVGAKNIELFVGQYLSLYFKKEG